MKKVLLLLTMLITQAALADQHQQFTQQGKVAIKEFAGTLKGALVAAMKSGGPIEAINVCNQVAPSIAADLSQKYGFEIARTSLKVRNPNNTADKWEHDVLHQFEERKQQGQDIKTLFINEAITQTASHELRMMKAIPTGEVCLTCHGRKIAPTIQARINQLYPHDQAVGFSLGDIRGSFTVRKIID